MIKSQRLSTSRVCTIALLVSLLAIIVCTASSDSLYALFFFASCSPGVFIFTIVYCYVLLALEARGFLYPNVFFRFMTPFLFFSLAMWVFSYTEYVSDFQQYSVSEYLNIYMDFSFDFLLPMGLCMALVSIMLPPVKEEERVSVAS
ncbi:hypothetical protein SAMN05421820_101693 [Pedobacter steynii]|uniref:Uncharacterized protein n=1 Tax=Pedobacter steynii TaxID=430522 RepID=A0A1G9KX11_9SPHI|nr:hypothetical protein [Pedobacter steynii]NQX38662.1 hypothetical protein [Pedobacter steynii]SDL54043.1 hypothetical protein SAMN05421820_101693 [Pedobacter steynii]